MSILLRNLVISTFLSGAVASYAAASNFDPNNPDLVGMATATYAEGRATDLYQRFVNQGRDQAEQNQRNDILLHVARMRLVIGGSTFHWDRLTTLPRSLENVVYGLSHLVVARPIVELMRLPYGELVDALLPIHADAMFVTHFGEVRERAARSQNPHARRIAEWAIGGFQRAQIVHAYDRMVNVIPEDLGLGDIAAIFAMFDTLFMAHDRNIDEVIVRLTELSRFIDEINDLPAGPAAPLSFGNFAARFDGVLNMIVRAERVKVDRNGGGAGFDARAVGDEINALPYDIKVKLLRWSQMFEGADSLVARADREQIAAAARHAEVVQRMDATNWIAMEPQIMWRAAWHYNIPFFAPVRDGIIRDFGLDRAAAQAVVEREIVDVAARRLQDREYVVPDYMHEFKTRANAAITQNAGRLDVTREVSEFICTNGKKHPGGRAEQERIEGILTRVDQANNRKTLKFLVKRFLQFSYDFLTDDTVPDEDQIAWEGLAAYITAWVDQAQPTAATIPEDLLGTPENAAAFARLGPVDFVKKILVQDRVALGRHENALLRARFNRAMNISRREAQGDSLDYDQERDRFALNNLLEGVGQNCLDGVATYVGAFEGGRAAAAAAIRGETCDQLCYLISNYKKEFIRRFMQDRSKVDFGEDYAVRTVEYQGETTPYLEVVFSSMLARRADPLLNPGYPIDGTFDINSTQMLMCHLLQGRITDRLRQELIDKFRTDFVNMGAARYIQRILGADIQDLERLILDIRGQDGVMMHAAHLGAVCNHVKRYIEVLKVLNHREFSVLSTLDLINFLNSNGKIRAAAIDFIVYSTDLHFSEMPAVAYYVADPQFIQRDHGPSNRGWLYILERLGLVEIDALRMQEIIDHGTIAGVPVDDVLAREDREVKAAVLADDDFYR